MRLNIPSEIKRAVRQHCGFGCVICGSPIYDYDHIEDYAVVREHAFENMVLLCPSCHRKKTNGLISREAVRVARDAASERPRTSTDAFESQRYKFWIGNNVVDAFKGLYFSICEFGYISLNMDSIPLINGRIYDKQGNIAIEVIDNEYTFCSNTWDIEYVGKTITFRNSPRQVFASITVDAESRQVVLTCNIKLKNGVRIIIRNDGIFANNTLLAKDNIILNNQLGLVITADKVGATGLGGEVKGATILNSKGIGIVNAINATNNLIAQCDYSFIWEKDFLEHLVKK